MKKKYLFLLVILVALALSNPVTSITIKSVSAPSLAPGEEGEINIEIENTLGSEVKDISLSLVFNNLPFIPIGSSEDSLGELDGDDDEELTFKIKAANNIKPGDYEIPYNIQYTVNKEIKKRTGSIGIKVEANPDLAFTISTEKPVIGKQDRLTLKIINKGFADAKFVSVKLIPEGFTLLSDSEIYVGAVDSDDFETAEFDIIYDNQKPIFSAIVEYINFENKKITKIIDLPIKVYTEDKATELGLIKNNNLALYISILITLVLIFILYRIVRRRIKDSKRKKEKLQ